MEEQSVTRAELAKRLGGTTGRISQLLAGETNFAVRTLADRFGVLVDRPVAEDSQQRGVACLLAKAGAVGNATSAATSRRARPKERSCTCRGGVGSPGRSVRDSITTGTTDGDD